MAVSGGEAAALDEVRGYEGYHGGGFCCRWGHFEGDVGEVGVFGVGLGFSFGVFGFEFGGEGRGGHLFLFFFIVVAGDG